MCDGYPLCAFTVKTSGARTDAGRKLSGHSGATNKDSKTDEVASKMRQLEARMKVT